MKKSLLSLLLGLFSLHLSYSQKVVPANVYPSNLEENMYFEKYDDVNKKITGLYFLVLADGDNSKDVTPAFTVKLYLMPEGKTSESDIIVVKTYSLDGLYNMGSMEYKNEVVDLNGLSIQPGRYRLGIWVNADKSFSEDASDNATLFKGVIVYGSGTGSNNTNTTTQPNNSSNSFMEMNPSDDFEEEEESDDSGDL